ncbi:mitochondrial dynamics protein MID51-like [Acanthaster planci]|uniref:Mitochondrial dynamics protein MID51-like n=1 Tax=Acanthaster planci TaxID=133434 RepID=A0A8B7YQ83_ACAPL|nr:mitochondrial dynamics protein MID51-like [Acanthaster planci]XP_022093586.1 mitochondrial dynamics protein MID51-like [Acanthaster planci]
MATGGGGKGWKHQGDGTGSGSWLLTGLKIGAAIGAAALGAYAAVKMSQREEKETPMRNRCCSGSDDEEEREGSASPSSHPTVRDGPGQLSKPKRKTLGSLVDELNEYYTSHVSTSSPKTLAIQALVEKTRQNLSSYLIRNHRRLIKGELTPVAFDSFTSSQQTEFGLMLPLAFNPQMWEFIDASDTVLDIAGFFCVRRINLDFFGIGKSPWDRFLIGCYLCPELLTEFWKTIVEQMLRAEMVLDFYCTVRCDAGGVELNIENPVGGYADMLRIKIIPYMQVDKAGHPVTITTQSAIHIQNPGGPTDERMSPSNPHENLWLQLRDEEALHKVEILDRDGGCRRKCLAILADLRSSHPPLKMLSLYVMTTILLKVCEEETEWDEEMLAERFLDLLKALEGYLRAGGLRDHFDEKIDVLARSCSLRRIAECQRWLAHVLESKDRISDLLYE